MDLQNNFPRRQRGSKSDPLDHYAAFARDDDLLTDINEGSRNTLTCPSCRISIIPTRLRSMCPFCGSFYDPAIEEDVSHRIHVNRDKGILGDPSARDHIHGDDQLDSGRNVHSRSYGSSQLVTSPSSSRRSDLPSLRLPRIVSPFVYLEDISSDQFSFYSR